MVSKQHKLFYGSSYDRGLDILLKMWPAIKKRVPEATLDICYGWDLFIKGYSNNPERLAWMRKMDEAMTQPGITHHGRVGKKDLAKIRQECGVWVYPTYFPEINCITALECQRDGLVPVTMDSYALKETVGSGIRVAGDIYDKETKATYLLALTSMMLSKDWQKESESAKQFAKNYDWDKIAKEWEAYFA